jgi:hypothetical protein
MIKTMTVFMAAAALMFGLFVTQMIPMWGALMLLAVFSLLVLRKAIKITN